MIQEISDKLPKIEEKLTKISIKHFEKFQLFVMVVFLRFFQCCTPKSSIGSDFGVKPKRSLFLNCFLPQSAFLPQICFVCPNIVFSLTPKQW